jgi:trigger factor
MPDIVVTPLPKSEVKLEFTVSVEEAEPYLEEALKDLSTHRPIPGFRPGKVPMAEAKRVYGEMAIYEAALERLVRALYVRAILEKELNTVGSPSVNVDQLTPGNPIKFTVIAPTEPTVTKMPDLSACKVSKKENTVSDKQLDEALEEMRKMRRTEAVVDRAATVDDLVIIDLQMHKDHVAVEGGSGQNYRVYLNEDQYIPGFSKELIGMKKDEERVFTLPFPKDHFQKHLAGQDIQFTAKAKDVYELKQPDLDDAFAQGVGLEKLETLKTKLRENMQVEFTQKAHEAAEIELLEKLVDAASFSEVPEILVNEEVRRMSTELQQSIEQQGMKWEDYLQSIKKDPSTLKLDFVPQAMRRVRTAVLIKAFGKEAKIQIDDKEVDTEIDRILDSLRENDTETRERVASPEYREYVVIQMRNRKTLEWLKEQCVS